MSVEIQQLKQQLLKATSHKNFKTNLENFKQILKLLDKNEQSIYHLVQLIKEFLQEENDRQQNNLLEFLEFLTFNLDSETFKNEINRKSFLKIINKILLQKSFNNLLRNKIFHLIHLWKIYFQDDLQHQNFLWYYQLLQKKKVKFPNKCKSQYFKSKKNITDKPYKIDEKKFKKNTLKLFNDLQLICQNVTLSNLLITNSELSTAIQVSEEIISNEKKLEILPSQLLNSQEEFLFYFVTALQKDINIMKKRLSQLQEGKKPRKPSQYYIDVLITYFPNIDNFSTVTNEQRDEISDLMDQLNDTLLSKKKENSEQKSEKKQENIEFDLLNIEQPNQEQQTKNFEKKQSQEQILEEIQQPQQLLVEQQHQQVQLEQQPQQEDKWSIFDNIQSTQNQQINYSNQNELSDRFQQLQQQQNKMYKKPEFQYQSLEQKQQQQRLLNQQKNQEFYEQNQIISNNQPINQYNEDSNITFGNQNEFQIHEEDSIIEQKQNQIYLEPEQIIEEVDEYEQEYEEQQYLQDYNNNQQFNPNQNYHEENQEFQEEYKFEYQPQQQTQQHLSQNSKQHSQNNLFGNEQQDDQDAFDQIPNLFSHQVPKQQVKQDDPYSFL